MGPVTDPTTELPGVCDGVTPGLVTLDIEGFARVAQVEVDTVRDWLRSDRIAVRPRVHHRRLIWLGTEVEAWLRSLPVREAK